MVESPVQQTAAAPGSSAGGGAARQVLTWATASLTRSERSSMCSAVSPHACHCSSFSPRSAAMESRSLNASTLHLTPSRSKMLGLVVLRHGRFVRFQREA
jgi:hypothetical protein